METSPHPVFFSDYPRLQLWGAAAAAADICSHSRGPAPCMLGAQHILLSGLDMKQLKTS